MERVQIIFLKEIGNLLKDKHEEKRKSSYTIVGLIFGRLSLLLGRGLGLGPDAVRSSLIWLLAIHIVHNTPPWML